jgi:hypothetical protein
MGYMARGSKLRIHHLTVFSGMIKSIDQFCSKATTRALELSRETHKPLCPTERRVVFVSVPSEWTLARFPSWPPKHV